MRDRVTVLKTRYGLIETKDNEIEKPMWRRPGFNGIRTMEKMEGHWRRVCALPVKERASPGRDSRNCSGSRGRFTAE